MTLQRRAGIEKYNQVLNNLKSWTKEELIKYYLEQLQEWPEIKSLLKFLESLNNFEPKDEFVNNHIDLSLSPVEFKKILKSFNKDLLVKLYLINKYEEIDNDKIVETTKILKKALIRSLYRFYKNLIDQEQVLLETMNEGVKGILLLGVLIGEIDGYSQTLLKFDEEDKYKLLNTFSKNKLIDFIIHDIEYSPNAMGWRTFLDEGIY